MKHRFVNRFGWEKWIEVEGTPPQVAKLIRDEEPSTWGSVPGPSGRLSVDVYEREEWREGEDSEIVYVDRLGNPDFESDTLEERFQRGAPSRRLNALLERLEDIIEPFARAEDQGKHASAMFTATNAMGAIGVLVKRARAKLSL